jgi:hypothetical protein
MAGKAGRPTAGGDKPLPETGQVADHKAHLLSQSQIQKFKNSKSKFKKQTANHHNKLTAGEWLTDH